MLMFGNEKTLKEVLGMFDCKRISVGVLAVMAFSGSLMGSDELSLRTMDGLELGVQAYQYKYEEKVDGNFFMSTEGQKMGASLTWTTLIHHDWFFSVDGRFALGDVAYASATGNGDVSDKVYEGRWSIGKETITHDGYVFASYLGGGYRLLKNDLRDLGDSGYRRESSYLYIPIGLIHRAMLDQSSRLSTKIEYDYLIWGEQKSYLSDYDPAYRDMTNEQPNGYGIRTSIAYERAHWSAGVFFNYWNIKASEEWIDSNNVAWVEPRNNTKEVGLELKYRF
jgi:hypothetical protein